MIVRLHGFNWQSYTSRIMPPFARWLIHGDEEEIHHLYEQTRCAYEERSLPLSVGGEHTWQRARDLVRQLPRGPHMCEEYQELCSAQEFTALSDRYVYRHPPQLHQQSEALRTLWAALVETYCLFPFPVTSPALSSSARRGRIGNTPSEQHADLNTTREELVAILQSANLDDLARAIEQDVAMTPEDEGVKESAAHLQATQSTQTLSATGTNDPLSPGEDSDVFIAWFNQSNIAYERLGIAIGRLPAPLLLRGWLAAHSIRAMALFELLVCGRRAMPFGFRAGDHYACYSGYLIPDEVWHLAASLRAIQVPDVTAAREDYRLYREQRHRQFRMIDEVLPGEAETLLHIVRFAANAGWGLLCSIY